MRNNQVHCTCLKQKPKLECNGKKQDWPISPCPRGLCLVWQHICPNTILLFYQQWLELAASAAAVRWMFELLSGTFCPDYQIRLLPACPCLKVTGRITFFFLNAESCVVGIFFRSYPLGMVVPNRRSKHLFFSNKWLSIPKDKRCTSRAIFAHRHQNTIRDTSASNLSASSIRYSWRLSRLKWSIGKSRISIVRCTFVSIWLVCH